MRLFLRTEEIKNVQAWANKRTQEMLVTVLLKTVTIVTSTGRSTLHLLTDFPMLFHTLNLHAGTP